MKYICQYCGKEFNNKNSLAVHVRDCLQNPNYKKPKGHKTWTKEKFISKAIEIHGNKFDYSLVEEFNNYKFDKIKIICNDCGNIFETSPKIHLKSGMGGCKICSKKEKWTTEKFIKIAKIKHNNKYDYSLVNIDEARKNNNLVKIICPIHGVFEQTWKLHLRGAGCKQCFLESQFSTLEEFIEKAKQVHGDKYDYSKSIYKGRNYKINIICPIHGEFITTPANHLNGHQCDKCAHNFIFYRDDKLNLLEKHDLLSMSWSVILDLIGENKLPKEFNQLCKFGENTPERKKMIKDLIDTYNIEVNNEEDENDVIDNENDLNTNIETKVNDIDDEIYDDIENEDELKPYKEIKDLGKLLDKEFDETLFSTGDKWVHIMSKEIGKLWNNVLRDNEKHNENTINEIHQKLKNNSLTKFEKYVYEEFIKEYNEVMNLKVH